MAGTSRGQALARAGTIGPQRGRDGEGDDALPKLEGERVHPGPGLSFEIIS